MLKNTETIGLRKAAHVQFGWSGLRNDGTSSAARTYHSSSKHHYSRIHKVTKPVRIKTGTKAIINHIY